MAQQNGKILESGIWIPPSAGEVFEHANGNGMVTTAEWPKRIPRILVGITCGFQLDSWFAQSFLGALVGQGELFYAETFWAIGYITDDGRNEIAKHALENGYDFVFYMDSDMIFPRATLAKLLRSAAEIKDEAPPVIGGIYNTRGDHRVNVYEWREEGKFPGFMPKLHDLNSGVHPVDFIATGCQLIDCGVFEAIDWPWFEYWYKPGPPDGKRKRWSEDAVFAKKCMDAGIKHYVDTGIVCKHLHNVAIQQVSRENFQVEKLSGEVYL